MDPFLITTIISRLGRLYIKMVNDGTIKSDADKDLKKVCNELAKVMDSIPADILPR